MSSTNGSDSKAGTRSSCVLVTTTTPTLDKLISLTPEPFLSLEPKRTCQPQDLRSLQHFIALSAAAAAEGSNEQCRNTAPASLARLLPGQFSTPRHPEVHLRTAAAAAAAVAL
jgi:hypothetical protein